MISQQYSIILDTLFANFFFNDPIQLNLECALQFKQFFNPVDRGKVVLWIHDLFDAVEADRGGWWQLYRIHLLLGQTVFFLVQYAFFDQLFSCKFVAVINDDSVFADGIDSAFVIRGDFFGVQMQ